MLKVLGEDSGKFKAVASGTLPNGKPVVVNADGTVSAVAGSAESIGTPVVFETGSVAFCSATFDSTNNKVVVAYMDGGFSDYGTVVVGTVSGSSITFGTPVVYESAASYRNSIAYDSNAGKVVIAYSDYGDSRRGKAIVGTVSGTSISFGSAETFESGSTSVQNYVSTVFDSTNNKIIISYIDESNLSRGSSIVGTVSGTSISFGSQVIFDNNDSTNYLTSVFDSNAGKLCIFYNMLGSSYGIVGTVSGTSISFGSRVLLGSPNATYLSGTFDTSNNKIVFTYQDGNNSSYGTAVVATVSGTSVSFGTPQVFASAGTFYTSASFDTDQNRVLIAYGDNDNGLAIPAVVNGTSLTFEDVITFKSTQTQHIGSAFDTNQNSFVPVYRDGGNGDKGTGSAVQVGYDNTVRTETPDGDTAFVNIIGSTVNNQNALTAGVKYYVQTDGTLSTTAGDPSVLAGTAISATKLVVKT